MNKTHIKDKQLEELLKTLTLETVLDDPLFPGFDYVKTIERPYGLKDIERAGYSWYFVLVEDNCVLLSHTYKDKIGFRIQSVQTGDYSKLTKVHVDLYVGDRLARTYIIPVYRYWE